MNNYSWQNRLGWLWVLVLFFVLHSVNAQPLSNFPVSPHIIKHSLTTEEGLPANGVNKIIQDSKNYLWAATYNGLVRYDGSHIEIFNTSEIEELGSNRFLTLFEDSEGCIWAGLEYSYILTVCEDSANVIRLDETPSGLNQHVTYLSEGRNGTMWIGTNRGVRILKEEKYITPESAPEQTVQKIVQHGDEVYVMFQRKLLWFRQDGTFIGEMANLSSEGIIHAGEQVIDELRDDEMIFTDLEIYENHFRLLTHTGLVDIRPSDYEIIITREQFNQQLLLGMRQHKETLYLFGTDGVVSIEDSSQPVKLSGEFVNDILIDHEGSVWQSTRSHGLQQLVFTPVFQNNLFSDLQNMSVTAILYDSNRNIWTGTNCDGLYRYHGKQVDHFEGAEGFVNTCVWSLMEQQDGTIWAGTWGGGVYRKTVDANHFTRFQPEGFEHVNEILAIYEDEKGGIWFGSYYDGLYRYADGKVEAIKDEQGRHLPAVRMFYEDSSGRFWMATDGGIKLYEKGRVSDPEYPELQQMINFRTITEGPRHSLWFGSYGHGIYALTKEDSLQHIAAEQGLYDETISQMNFDPQGNLWIAGNDGVFLIDSLQVTEFLNDGTDNFRISRFGVNEGMPIRETTGGFMPSSAIDDDGYLYIPTVQGLVVIHTPQLKLNEAPPSVIIQNVLIDGDPVLPRNVESLSYQNQRVVFHFAALSYVNPRHVQIEYMLEGLDDGWQRGGNDREAVYTTLPPGEYEFRVRAANNDGFWNHEGDRLAFTITSPFWQQAWFILLCTLLLMGGLAGIFQYRVWRGKQREIHLRKVVNEQTATIREEKEQLQKAFLDMENQKKVIEENGILIKQQAEKLSKQDELKSRFFANISHELRTPLTLIKGIAEQALKGKYGSYSEDLHRELKILEYHANRLHAQVEYLLDLAEIEIGDVTLSKKIFDLNDLLKVLAGYFKTWASQHNVHFSLGTADKPVLINADPKKIEKVLLSIFFNAIHYTREGNHIAIKTKQVSGKDGRWVKCICSHDGRKMTAGEEEFVFDKFHHHTKIGGLQTKSGLALVKEWVELHEGAIELNGGNGTENSVIFTLPLSESGTANLHSVQVQHTLPHNLETAVSSGNEKEKGETSGQKRKTILLVEDETPIRFFIRKILGDSYNITEAENGREGIEKIRENPPDLVITDVMMPEMDGHEFCRKLRENSDTRSLPVIMLTAKANLESRLEALQNGADAYITKPFKETLLRETISNLFETRQRFIDELDKKRHLEHLLTEKSEDSLLSKLDQLINTHLENPELTIEELANQLHVSQRQLQRKIKQQTGLTPKKYLRKRRLQAARHLLEHDYGTVTQVAYAVGFSTLSLFSSYFKSEFGNLPSEVNRLN